MAELNSGIALQLVNLPTADAVGAAVRARGESCFLDAGNMCTTLVQWIFKLTFKNVRSPRGRV